MLQFIAIYLCERIVSDKWDFPWLSFAQTTCGQFLFFFFFLASLLLPLLKTWILFPPRQERFDSKPLWEELFYYHIHPHSFGSCFICSLLCVSEKRLYAHVSSCSVCLWWEGSVQTVTTHSLRVCQECCWATPSWALQRHQQGNMTSPYTITPEVCLYFCWRSPHWVDMDGAHQGKPDARYFCAPIWWYFEGHFGSVNKIKANYKHTVLMAD